MSSILKLLNDQLEEYRGVARMVPLWIPQTFLPPGKRLKLHPDDIYPFGIDKGAVCERWFCSTGMLGSNGTVESTMSHFYLGEGDKAITFSEAISLMGNELLGKETMDEYGTFSMLVKMFDYGVSLLPLHTHPKERYSSRVGKAQKPECNYFPIELNRDTFGHDRAFFGLIPGTTKERFLKCIKDYNKGETNVLSLCQGYKVNMGTAWLIPSGLLHAPSSAVTYEPQLVSDSLLFYQNLIDEKYVMGYENVQAMIPADMKGDFADYLLEMIDWEANFDNFHEKYLLEPIPVKAIDDMLADGYHEEWNTYGTGNFSTKRLRVLPGRTVTIKDSAAYGFVMMQGYGKLNGMEISTPTIIRFGQQTADEAFVTKSAAQAGVVIENGSRFEEIVMLKHFSGDNKEAPKALI